MLIRMATTKGTSGSGIARAVGYAETLALRGGSALIPAGLGRASLRRAFARNLCALRGIPMKASQVLGMADGDGGRLHREAIAELPPVDGAAMLGRLALLSPALRAGVAGFGFKGIPASIGQVHRVRMADGRDCAVKLRYPGIESAVGLDAGTLDLLLGMFSGRGRGFPLDAYRTMLADELRGELDYRAEARKQAAFKAGFEGVSGIVIPRPYPDESGDEHILMDWEGSTPPGEFAAKADVSGKARAMDRLSGFLMGSIFRLGSAHADPNPGNFGFRASRLGPELVVYDYGSVVELPPRMPSSLLDLMRALRDGDDPHPHLLDLGFAPEPLEPIRARLPAFCEVIFAPFLASSPLHPREWNRKERASLILGPHRWNFMIAAPVSAFPLMRAMHGLVHYAALLDSPIHLRPRLDALLHQGSRGAPAPDGPAVPRGAAPGRAGTLRVRLRAEGETKVDLTLPRGAVDRLGSLLDPEIRERIASRGIELDGVAARARAAGYRPATLFECSYEGRTIEVWLE